MDKKNIKRLIFGALGIIVMVLFVYVLPVPQSFVDAAASVEVDGRVAFGTFGIILFAIIWWAGAVYPTWITSLLMMCFMVFFQMSDVKTTFAGFVGNTFWIIFGGLCLAAACEKSGVLKRLALVLMKIFPASYKGQVAAILVIGTIIQPLIPTTAPKVMLLLTLAMAQADALGLPKLSKGRYGLFAASFLGGSLTAPAFLNSSSTIMNGNNLLEAPLGMMEWTIRAIPWLLVVLIGGYLAICFICYREKESTNVDKTFANAELAKLGKISRDEIVTIVALIFALVFWIQGELSAGLVSICAGMIPFLCGTLKNKDIKGLNWGLLIYVGSLTTLSGCFKANGLNTWIQDMLGPVLQSIPSMFLLIIAVIGLVIAVRFVLVSQATNVSIFVLFLGPIFAGMGIDPFVAAFVTLSAQQVFFMPHQNTAYAPLVDMTDGGVEHKGVIKFAFTYQVLSLIGIAASWLYWSATGVL